MPAIFCRTFILVLSFCSLLAIASESASRSRRDIWSLLNRGASSRSYKASSGNKTSISDAGRSLIGKSVFGRTFLKMVDNLWFAQKAKKIIKRFEGFEDIDQFFKQNPQMSFEDYATSKNFPEFNSSFIGFIKNFNRQYKSFEETFFRKMQFLLSLKAIKLFNKLGLTYGLGINSLADRTDDEYHKRLGTEIPPASADIVNSGPQTRYKRSTTALPESFDWRTKNVVGAVYDQGECMSCWAFATADAIQIQTAIRNGSTPRLSPQQLMDCTSGVGCEKGYWPKYALKKLIQNYDGQLTSFESYPYDPVNPKYGECKKVFDKPAKVVSFVALPQNTTDDDMMDAIYNKGPISVVMKFDPFKLYTHGVVYEHTCVDKGTHAVIVVGWGKDGDKQYWIVKNSFGPDWGEKGYVRVARGKNICFINKYVSYPVVN